MLRNHCGWAWRLFVAFLLLFFFYCPTARGGPLIGLPPVMPVHPPGSPPPGISRRSIRSPGMCIPIAGGTAGGGWGLSGVQMSLG